MINKEFADCFQNIGSGSEGGEFEVNRGYRLRI